MRLAMIYALLDGSSLVRVDHLQAALAVWDYCFASAQFIFGDEQSDAVEDRILLLLKTNPHGVSQTTIRDHFGRNVSDLSGRLVKLQQRGAITSRKPEGKCTGRPETIWKAI